MITEAQIKTTSFNTTLKFKLESHRRNCYYFREYLRDYMKNGSKKTKPDGSDYDIYKDGLKSIQRLILGNCMLRKQLQHIANLQEEFSFNLKPIKTHHS
jgi:penicillin-binding protein 1A